MPVIPTLYTPRLTLRSLAIADAARIRELAGDARIAATTAHVPHPYPEGAAETFIASREPAALEDREFTFGITLAGTRTPGRELDLAETGHLIGVIGICRDGLPEHRRAVLGYWIGVPYWNKGFATEAACAVLSFAFTRKNFHRIEAHHLAANPSSGRVMQKIGMTQEGVLRQRHFKNGVFHDVAAWSILQEEWIRSRKTGRLRPAASLQAA